MANNRQQQATHIKNIKQNWKISDVRYALPPQLRPHKAQPLEPALIEALGTLSTLSKDQLEEVHNLLRKAALQRHHMRWNEPASTFRTIIVEDVMAVQQIFERRPRTQPRRSRLQPLRVLPGRSCKKRVTFWDKSRDESSDDPIEDGQPSGFWEGRTAPETPQRPLSAKGSRIPTVYISSDSSSSEDSESMLTNTHPPSPSSPLGPVVRSKSVAHRNAKVSTPRGKNTMAVRVKLTQQSQQHRRKSTNSTFKSRTIGD
jgi:hypothetical protein